MVTDTYALHRGKVWHTLRKPPVLFPISRGRTEESVTVDTADSVTYPCGAHFPLVSLPPSFRSLVP